MFSLFDWDKLYDVTPETRLLLIEGERTPVVLPANIWAWLDYFRNGEPVETFARGTLAAVREIGDTCEMALAVYVMARIDAERADPAPASDSPFAPSLAAKLEKALLYLPIVNGSLTAREEPAHWWSWWRASHRDEARILAFDDETRTVTLPARVWMILDVAHEDRASEDALGAYIADADEDAEAAARALRALAKLRFERLCSEGNHPILAEQFRDEIDEMTRFVGA